MCCYQSQSHKIWKQFTTKRPIYLSSKGVLSITKFQSNSQRGSICTHILRSCYQSQNYKIWKQFTTGVVSALWCSGLLSITKLQNFKAIHNGVCLHPLAREVVINHKTTKIESNSQRIFICSSSGMCCYQSQNYKIWKQFTTSAKGGP